MLKDRTRISEKPPDTGNIFCDCDRIPENPLATGNIIFDCDRISKKARATDTIFGRLLPAVILEIESEVAVSGSLSEDSYKK